MRKRTPPVRKPAPFVGFAMNAGYRHAFETTNEFVRMKF